MPVPGIESKPDHYGMPDQSKGTENSSITLLSQFFEILEQW